MSSERGNLIIVSAASGSGKSTLVDLVIARMNADDPGSAAEAISEPTPGAPPEAAAANASAEARQGEDLRGRPERAAGVLASRVERCVTCTTRPPRGAERDGVDYHFLSVEEFERRIAAGDFLEYARVHGERLYGTSRSAVEAVLARGVDLFLVIDVQGAEAVRAAMPEAVGVFILPPSFSALEARLVARNAAQNLDDAGDLAARLASARREVTRYGEFDYVIVNDDRDRAAAALANVVAAERCRARGQAARIREILSSFAPEGESFHA